MSRFLLLFLGLILISCSKISEDLASEKPKVKSVVISEYNASKSGEIDRNIALMHNVSGRHFYDENEDLINSQTFNHKGRLTSNVIFTRNKDSIIRIAWDSNKVVIKRWISILNKNGNIVELQTYNSDNTLIRVQKKTYDSGNKGHILRSSTRNLEENYTNTSEYKYDLFNKLKERIDVDSSKSPPEILLYKYDGSGNIYTVVYQQTRSATQSIDMEYDGNNNAIRTSTISISGNTAYEGIAEYTYDQYGNWTTMKEGTKGFISYVAEREFTYYKTKKIKNP